MSRTRKDSVRLRDTVLEVVRVGDDTFDLFLNRELYRGHVPETALPDWLWRRYGFCADEYDAILRELKECGRRSSF